MSGKKLNRVRLHTAVLLLALSSLSSTTFAAAGAIKTAKVTAMTTPKSTLAATSTIWGDYYKPFAATSLWNSRPVEPIFGTFVIPKSSYFPSIAAGSYSTGVFLAQDTDGPMTVYPISGATGVMDQDSEVFRPSITIPRWPANTLPATGSDGHADIVDPTTGIIHSFFKLKMENGRWVALLYAWMPLAGSGWPEPAHYYQGARAVGIPASAGLMRRHEIDDGKATYQHALAMSLTYNGLAANPAYVFPAGSADNGAATQNSGSIPEGALLMLPANYDTSQIASPALRKVAETLKLYGAYVVDRNVGTPFVIYVEIGSTFKMSTLAWDNAVAAELDRIRANLRQVVGATSWVDGNGNVLASPVAAKIAVTAPNTPTTVMPAPFIPPADLNLLSMRGPWALTAGPALGTFNSLTQALEFPARTVGVSQSNSTGRGLKKINWATPMAGDRLRLTGVSTGGATVRLCVFGTNNVGNVDSGHLANGQSVEFTWPAGGWTTVTVKSGILGVPSTARGNLVFVR